MKLTKEQAEAWRIAQQMIVAPGLLEHGVVETCMILDEALAAYDREQKTGEIQFNSFDHSLLMFAQHVGLRAFELDLPKLKRFLDNDGFLNNEGREVLAALNAMCKGEK